MFLAENRETHLPNLSVADHTFPIVEFRQYTLHPGRRDTLIAMFEKHFIEPQHAVGIRVIGTFRDADRPDRFVWLRGFQDMDSRLAGLTAFYGGPVWQEHRNAANATMIDSDNVLLLRAPTPAAEFADGDDASSAGMVLAAVHYCRSDPADALATFESTVRPSIEESGIAVIAWFVNEREPNNFPRLPVRDERTLVWFARFENADDLSAHMPAVDAAIAPLAAPSEFIRLEPTTRSNLR